MKFYGIEQSEDSVIKNLTVDHGTSFPSLPTPGELFFKTSAPSGLYCYDGNTSSWSLQGTPSGLGTIASQNADNVAITGGNINGIANLQTTGPALINGAINDGANKLQILGNVKFGEASAGGYLISPGAGNVFMASAQHNGANWIAKAAGASIINQTSSGELKIYTNGALTAGNAFTPTERIKLQANGRLLINTSADDNIGVIQIGGNTSIKAPDPAHYISGNKSGGNQWLMQTVDSDGRFRIYDGTNSIERLTISQAGNLSVQGTFTLAADPTSNLHAATKQYVDNILSNLTIDGGTY